MEGSVWLRTGKNAGSCKHYETFTGSIKSTEFGQLKNYQLIKKHSAPCS